MAGATPDVRVRLSAEGVQEVVSAFRTISSEGQKATKETAESAKELVEINLAEWAMRAAETFKEFAEASLEMQEGIARLIKVTGMSAETLSVLQRAAKLNEGDINDVALAYKKLSVAVDGAYAKNAKMEAVFSRLGLTVKDLVGLTPDQLFIKVATALGNVGDETERTAIATAIFGKSTQQLLLISDDLAHKGFPQMAEEAKKAGQIFSREDVEAAEKFNQKLKDLKLSAEALAGKLIDAAQEFPKTTKAIMTPYGLGAFAIPFTFAADKRSQQKAADQAAEEDQKKAAERDEERIAQVKKIQAQEAAVEAGHAAAMTKLRVDAEKMAAAQILAIRQLALAREASADDAAYAQGLLSVGAYYDKRAARIAASTDAEIADLEARRAATQKENGAEVASLNAQIGAQKALNGAAADTADLEASRNQAAVAGRNKLKEIDDQIALARKKEDNDLAANVQARNAADIENARNRLTLEQRIADAQGDSYKSAVIGIRLEAAELAKTLHTTVNDPAIQRLMALLQGQAIADNFAKQFSAQMAAVRQNIQGLDLFQQGLQNKVTGGSLFPAQAQAAYTAAIKQQLPILQEHLDVLKDAANTELQSAYTALNAAKATGADTSATREAVVAAMDHVQALEQEQQKLDQAKIAADYMAQQMGYLKQATQEAMANDLAQWLSSGIDQADGFVDAMRGLALSLVQSMRQILAQVLANVVVYELLTKILGKGKTDSLSQSAPQLMLASVFLGAGGAIVSQAADKLQAAAAELMAAATLMLVANSTGFASGGLVSGPGSGTSDSIPARLSNGEFVVRAAAVRRIGVGALAAINRGVAPAFAEPFASAQRFADGGLVDLSPGGTAAPTRAGLYASLDLDPVLLLKRMEATPEWARVHVRTTERNRRAVKSALGK